MEKSTEEKVNQALDYIRNDRMMAADPYFTARLMARSGHYFADPGYAASSRGLFLKLRPALAAVLVLT